MSILVSIRSCCRDARRFSLYLANLLMLLNLTLRQSIDDDSFSDKIRYLTMTDATKVWMPDTFFRNEKHGDFHNIIQPNLYIRVFPNGDILYSIR